MEPYRLNHASHLGLLVPGMIQVIQSDSKYSRLYLLIDYY